MKFVSVFALSCLLIIFSSCSKETNEVSGYYCDNFSKISQVSDFEFLLDREVASQLSKKIYATLEERGIQRNEHNISEISNVFGNRCEDVNLQLAYLVCLNFDYSNVDWSLREEEGQGSQNERAYFYKRVDTVPTWSWWYYCYRYKCSWTQVLVLNCSQWVHYGYSYRCEGQWSCGL